MTRTTFTLLLLILGASLAAAQKVTISDELPMRTDLSYDIIGELKGKVLLFRNEVNKFGIQAFDENMRSSWEKEIELDKKLINLIGITSTSDSFTLFYYFRERGSTILKAATFDASANLRDSITLTDLGFLFVTPEFEFIVSEDESKVMIYYPDRDDIFRVLVFDNQTMKLLWEKSFKDDDYNETEDVVHMMVDNRGGMHAVIEKDHFHSRQERHRYEVFRYSGIQGTEITQFAVPLKGMITFDVQFDIDNKNNRLTGGGFYYEKNPERAEGAFVLFIPEDPNGAVLKFKAFDDDFVDRLAGKEQRNNRGLEEIEVRDLVLRNDGGLLIIGEENKNYYRRMTTANRSMVYDNMSRSVVDYFYEDLFILAFYPDGNLHWNTILHKKQYSQDDEGVFSSYFLFKTPAFLRLIFNDEIKFENTVSEYVLRGTGQFDRNSILSTENLQLRLRFREGVQTSPERILVPSERRGRLRIARIDLL
ncbi:MAG: hypothetical protein IPN74_14610 [Haliscomenobacter sp.]|nr:hypothetical protein [Haliscomenobacter sp.]